MAISRLRIPDKRTIEGVIRVFVRTGPSVGDEACATDVDVGVDLKVAGALRAFRPLLDFVSLIGLRVI